MVKLLFFRFLVTKSNLKNIKKHFQLQVCLILEVEIYLFPVPLRGHQEKLAYFFGYIVNQIMFTS